jgi:hypothetical protein
MSSYLNKNGDSIERVAIFGNNEQISGDQTASWGNSAAAGTVVDLDIPLPRELQLDAKYVVVIRNPSTETALTVKVKNKESFGANVVYPEVISIAVPVNSIKFAIVEGWMLGEAGRLTLTNDAATGLAGAFTADIRIRKV